MIPTLFPAAEGPSPTSYPARKPASTQDKHERKEVLSLPPIEQTHFAPDEEEYFSFEI